MTGVPSELLLPSQTWADEEVYTSTLRHLAELFCANFKKFEDGGGYVGPEQAASIVQAGPVL